MIDNGILERIAAALEKMAETAALINENLSAIYNDPPYSGKAPEPVDDLGLCCEAPGESDARRLAAECKRVRDIIWKAADQDVTHPDSKCSAYYTMSAWGRRNFQRLLEAEISAVQKNIPIETRIEKMKAALGFVYDRRGN